MPTRVNAPRRDAPELFDEFLAPKRAWGMPGARCTRSLVCKGWWHTSVATTGAPGSPGIPARNGLRLIRDLPGDRAFLVTVACGVFSASLTPASRRQDHTTSPSASVPLVRGTSASTASRSNVRDDRDTPLKWDGMALICEVIWVGGKWNYFCQEDWTGQISLKRLRKLAWSGDAGRRSASVRVG
jgi:hypothetical protein